MKARQDDACTMRHTSSGVFGGAPRRYALVHLSEVDWTDLFASRFDWTDLFASRWASRLGSMRDRPARLRRTACRPMGGASGKRGAA